MHQDKNQTRAEKLSYVIISNSKPVREVCVEFSIGFISLYDVVYTVDLSNSLHSTPQSRNATTRREIQKHARRQFIDKVLCGNCEMEALETFDVVRLD